MIVVDVGGSEVRAAVLDSEGISWFGAGPAPGIQVRTPGAAARVGRAICRVLGNMPDDDRDQRTVGVGLSGWTDDPRINAELASYLRPAIGPATIWIADDAVTGYLGAIGVERGVVLSAGTGVVALAWNGTSIARTDGWGDMLGDAGGAFDIGRSVARSALAFVDGRGGSEQLATLMAGFCEPTRLPTLLTRAPNRRAMLASFAPLAFQAADDGDAVARAICAQAADDLATTTAAATRQAFTTGSASALVAYRGGLFATDSPFTRTFVAAFVARLRRKQPVGEVVAAESEQSAMIGAGLLPIAARRLGLKERVHRFADA